MKINISGQQLEVTDGIRQHIAHKMEKMKRHFDQPLEINVTVSVEKLNQKASLHLHALGRDFHVSKTAGQLYNALDEAIDVLDQQLQRQKSKLQEGRQTPTKKANHAQFG